MSKRVLIVGAGVIGLCTAYYAARRGHRVTVIDGRPPQYEGCSYGNAGMVVSSHFIPLAAPGMVALGLKWMLKPESPFYFKPRWDRKLWSWALKFWRAASAEHVRRSAPLLRDLSFASRDCFEELEKEIEFGLVKKGLLMLCKTEHVLAEEMQVAARGRALGIPSEALDPKQAARFEPNVRMEIAGGILYPKDCHLSPARFMAGLKKWLAELNTVFAWQTELTDWRISANRIEGARTTQGEISADEFVVCCGSWSSAAADGLGLRLPLQAGKGYSLTLPRPPQRPAVCAILAEARVAVTPMDGALRFGGTMEMAGLNEEINPARLRAIIKAVPGYYPDFSRADFAGIPPWAGLRPVTPDGLPYVGRTRQYVNLAVATGHAMMGVSLGPITGKLVAAMISDEEAAIDLRLLDPDRYNR